MGVIAVIAYTGVQLPSNKHVFAGKSYIMNKVEKLKIRIYDSFFFNVSLFL